jgi:Flp pilus assembly protein TadD
LNPRNAGAQGNLGKALTLQNRFAEAEPHFRAALEIKPGQVETLQAYGGALAAQGRLEEAVRHVSEAVRLKPDPDTRLQLAPLLAALGQAREAVIQCRAVLASKPDSTAALNNLAWLLATSSDATVRDGAEAVRLAEHACRLTDDKEAVMVGTLAAAYAEAGRFNDAIATAHKAIALAHASGNAGFAQANQQLLRLYQAGRAYHEPARRQ